MIAAIPLVTVTPRPLNERLWTLVGRDVDGTATPQETTELNQLFASLEAEGECNA